MKIGANAHPPRLVPQDVLDLGSVLARFPPWADDQLPPWETDFPWQPWIDAVQAGGCDVLMVLDDVCHKWKRPHQTWPAFYRQVREAFSTVNRFQILNEPDGLPGGSSGPHPPRYVNAHLRAARQGMGDSVILYAPGLIGSNPDLAGPDYAARLDLGAVDYLSVHLYGNPPSYDYPIPATGFRPIEDLIQDYLNFGKLIAVTEIGGEPGLFDDEGQRARYFSEAIRTMDAMGVAEALVYCLSPAQCGDLALVAPDGTPLESYSAWHDAAAVCG